MLFMLPVYSFLLKMIFHNELHIENGKISFNDDYGIGGPLNFDTVTKYLVSSNV